MHQLPSHDANRAPSPQPLTLSIKDAAKALGISKATAYEAAKTGEIPIIRVGRRLLVPVAALQRLLAEASR